MTALPRWRSFWAVIVPPIRPTILFTVVVSTIGGLQLFTEPQLFDASGPSGTGGNDRQFQTLVMYLYENGFGRFDAGYAATISWVLFRPGGRGSGWSTVAAVRAVCRGGAKSCDESRC